MLVDKEKTLTFSTLYKNFKVPGRELRVVHCTCEKDLVRTGFALNAKCTISYAGSTNAVQHRSSTKNYCFLHQEHVTRANYFFYIVLYLICSPKAVITCTALPLFPPFSCKRYPSSFLFKLLSLQCYPPLAFLVEKIKAHSIIANWY